MKNLIGILVGSDGRYNIVKCVDAPDHLKMLYLTDQQVRGAKFGDRVELKYFVTPTSGQWDVIKVLA